MSQLSTLERLSEVLAAFPENQAPAPATIQSSAFTLRRTGKRPIAFDGIELCMAMSYVPGTPFWYELNIYRTSVATFVVGIKFFTKDEGEKDIFRAFQAHTFDEVMSVLEGYDTSQDVRIDVQADDDTLSVAELTVKALGLRARLEEARRQFAGLVGQVLFELDS